MLKNLVKRATHALGIEIRRYRPAFRPGYASLRPDGTPKGNVLIAYILDPFIRKPGEPVSVAHTHHHESLLMTKVWLAHGYCVDVIDYRNDEFIPRKRYDFLVSARTNLETLAARLNPDCVKIVHLDTSHFAFNNHATYSRLLDLQRRRGFSLPGSIRLVEPNRAIEHADYGVVLGNASVLDTYRYAGKRLFALPVTSTVDHTWCADKDFYDCRNRFLWLGSAGFVHKGLDLTLEAFNGMPDMHLTVCGPIDSEPGFRGAYHKELYETANIRTAGWVDITGNEFQRIANSCVAIVYPSCAEAQATSVVDCLRAGLIPIVSKETGVQVGDFGVLLNGLSVEEIRNAVHTIAALPAEELAARAKRTWEYAAAHHSQDAYIRNYGEIVTEILKQCANRK